jgi:predicted RNA polymerase sigma factor
MTTSIADHIAELYATESRRVLATLIRLLGDIDEAEEALQEAFSAALNVGLATASRGTQHRKPSTGLPATVK